MLPQLSLRLTARSASRRGFITAAAALAAAPAFGLSQEPMEGSILSDYVGRCQAPATETADALAAALRDGDPTALIARWVGDIRSVGRCPLCGCSVAASDAVQHLSGAAPVSAP